MKLRNLKSVIRKHAGAPTTVVPTPVGGMEIALMKGELLKALDDRYGGDGMVETGLTFLDGSLRQDPEHLDMWRSVTLPGTWAETVNRATPSAEDDDQMDIEQLLAASEAETPGEPTLDDLLNV